MCSARVALSLSRLSAGLSLHRNRTHLVDLDVSSNAIQGTIPVDGFDGCTRLRSMSVRFVTGLAKTGGNH